MRKQCLSVPQKILSLSIFSGAYVEGEQLRMLHPLDAKSTFVTDLSIA